MSYVALRDLTIDGVAYGPGSVVDVAALTPRRLAALLEHRKLAPDPSGSAPPVNGRRRP